MKALILLVLSLLWVCAHPASAQSPNEQARFLAGLPVHDSALEPLTRQSAFAQHASALNQAWTQKSASLGQVRRWARTNLGERSGGTLQYFFSGPDALYAYSFMPRASTYILCGTEPVGNLPDVTRISAEALPSALSDLRRGMRTMLTFHYFITKEMRTDLQGHSLGGTLPILYVFLARLGATIEDVKLINQPAPGVQINFIGNSGAAQTLYYFKTNLANGGASGFLRWCATQGPAVSLLKSDSYLLHTDSFSETRRFLLDHSQLIVQDDSGVPLRDFDPRWTIRYFGNYTAPIELFAKYHQPDLSAAYQSARPAPLGFAFGYHWQVDRGALMLATRR